MAENWSLPTVNSNYATGVIQVINNKFIDTITLFRAGPGSNLPVNAIRYNGDLNGTFQRWNGSVWNNMILDLTGGGTGADNPTLARSNLGLGTMAVQNSNAVDITGGNATNLGTFSSNTVWANVLSSADGRNIAQLNAANISQGIVDPARLGNGLANSGVFLRGDQLWAAPAGTLPSGLIAMFEVACPAGWTRVAALDGRFPRGSTVYGGAGGGSTHNHGNGTLAVGSHAHGPGTFVAASHNHGGATGSVSISVSISGNTGSGGGHSHGFSASFSGTTNTAGSLMNVDAGGSGNMSRSDHVHSFSGSVSDDTDAVGGHTHSFSGSGSGSGTGSIGNSGTLAVSGTSATASPALSGSLAAADHTPYYLDVIWCKKD